ncbi:class I SAM-dependent DNA methyltransferase [Actinomadura sp. 9N407]|uniref:class I SAM-dependent DNA methyltransferase n=1 Tax=Actinomadura sp. 9N407 TaxID=3375154 RepID=UPI0037928046
MTEYFRNTRAGYDAMAADYCAHFPDDLDAKPLDRAMIAAFAEAASGPVADVGSGPGDVTARLHAHGLDVFGVDLSPGMLAHARRSHPGLRFDEGTMTALDVPDGHLGGLVAHYSIIHLPPAEVPAAFAEFHRALSAGGHLLLAFQVGDEPNHYSEAFGHTVDLDFHRLSPDHTMELLRKTGFDVVAHLVREARENEITPQAYILARKA